ncbi:septal ring lytic transglycosylase RlpA family protein [Piscinibacterium candidicorallinum]|uniref:Endolytic peptidoglycan transglycosylase RlpA n=1 Tax=Piscinibacterium candidicorallinum TaxID=1793872 RepID=A0ABV7H552_9BURK
MPLLLPRPLRQPAAARFARALSLAALALTLAACSSAPKRPATDGPGDKPPANWASIPSAVPRDEPAAREARGPNKPYEVLGQRYTPRVGDAPFRERGLASWYGRKFHGNRTASGEIYDMYGMTAAHRTLPLPSYARVTNVANGRSVIVRVNDRGPFKAGRVIDLTWTAAAQLGFINQGEAEVIVERVLAR